MSQESDGRDHDHAEAEESAHGKGNVEIEDPLGLSPGLDFGRGDDAYKSLWAGSRRQRIGVVLANPRRPAGLLALGRHGLGRFVRNWLRG